MKKFSKWLRIIGLSLFAAFLSIGSGIGMSAGIKERIAERATESVFSQSGIILLTVTTVTGSGSVISDFGTAVTAWLTLVVDMVVAAFAGVIEVFWVAEYGFTIYGLLMLFGLAVGFVGLALGFIRGLIQK